MLRTILACFLIGLIPGIAGAACGPIPSDYPVLAGDKLEVGEYSTVNNGTSTSDINDGAKYDDDAINPAINPNTGDIVSASPSFPSLDPATFPATGSTDTSDTTVAAGSYDDVTVEEETTTSFSGGSYYIDKLDIGKFATVNLAAGSYFIDQLILGDKAEVVVSSGPVQLYIGSEVSGKDDLSFNAAGAVADFQVFLYPKAKWQVGEDVKFVGVIYAPGTSSKIEFDDDSRIRGAVVTAGEVELGERANLIFSAADQAAAGGASTCVAAAAAPSGFNAFETSTAAGSVSGVIRTKIAGSAFGLDVVAVSGGAQESAFSDTVKVELLGNATTGVGLDANNCPTSFTLLQTVSPTPTISGGRSSVGFAAVGNAWRDVRVRISGSNGNGNGNNNGNGNGNNNGNNNGNGNNNNANIACSTDNFAIRPASFASFSVTDADWQSAGTTRSLNNMAATGGNVHKAGQPFTVNATAVNALATAAVTTNYTGTPTASLTTCSGSGCTSTFGIFSVGSAAAVAGVLNSTNASYTEAGAFTLQLQDMTFASVDVADGTPANCAGLYICSSPLIVGRFVPDHFSVMAGNTPSFKTFNDATCTSRSFTYIGQGFGYVTAPQALITAQNAAGVTTQNYRDALWRPVPAFAYSSPSGTLDTGLATTPTVVSNNDGTGSENVNGTDLLAYARNLTTPQAPFNANISLNLSVADPSEAGVTGNGTINTTTPAVFNGTGSGIAFDSGNAFRYGRLRLSNAFGSETLGLPIPLEAQYWNGTFFVTNGSDNCTLLNAGNIALGNYAKGLNATNMGTSHISLGGAFVNGKGSLKFTKPAPAASGSVDVAVNLGLGTGSVDQSCPAWTTTSNGAGMAYLRGRWCGANYDRDSRARVTFGIYKNANEFIYMREMY